MIDRYELHREKRRIYARAWYAKNKEKSKAYAKKWRDKMAILRRNAAVTQDPTELKED